MGKLQNVSINPTLEVLSETEPHSYKNAQRTNYSHRNPTQKMTTESKNYTQSINRHDGGHINQVFSGNSQGSIDRDVGTPSVAGVYREQYWICSQPLRCRNWTRRERILFFVLIALSTVVLGLVAVISFISRNSKDKTEPPPSWIPWL